jgi:anaerobic selenocysteine-containing dehydrogenase
MSNHNKSRREFIKTTGKAGVAAGIGLTILTFFGKCRTPTADTSFAQQALTLFLQCTGTCDRCHDDGDTLQQTCQPPMLKTWQMNVQLKSRYQQYQTRRPTTQHFKILRQNAQQWWRAL